MATFLANLTAGADSVLGTVGDDIIQVPPSTSNLSGADTIAAGAGFDTMLFLRDTSLAIGHTLLTNVSGVDEFDVTLASSVHIFLNDASILQSDSDRLRITFDADPMTLDLRAVSASLLNGIELNGSGTVTLYDVANQSLRIADGANGHVIGGTGRDAITGGTGADALTGNLGDDVLRGNNGADTLVGGDDQDWLFGGAGSDSLVGDAGFDLLDGGSGTNTATGGADADTFVVSTAETLTITDFDPTNAYERIDLRAFAGLSFDDLVISGNGGNALITLPSGSSVTLTGVAAAVLRAEMFIFAGDEVVTLAKGLGAVPFFEFTAFDDVVSGTSGDDVFEVKGVFSKLAGTDVFAGGLGTDTLRIWGADRTLSAANLAGMRSIEVIDMTGATGALAVTMTRALVTQSGTGNVTVKQGASAMILDTDTTGGVGAVIVEGTGEVTLRNADGQAITVSDRIAGLIQGGSRDDAIQGGALNDTIRGNDGNDSLWGGAGDDSLVGGAGDDQLTGQAGRNTVTGGNGTDRFVVTAGETLVITDFDLNDYFERIDLRAFAGLSYADLVMTNVTGGVEISLPDASTIIVQGRTVANMDATQFFFDGDLPSVSFQLTAGADSFVGGTGDDLFDVTGNIAQLDGSIDYLDGGAGIDTLRIFGTDRVLSGNQLGAMHSIEVLSLAKATGSHAVTLTDAQITGTEHNAITVRQGASSLLLDTALVSSPDAVLTEGNGVVTLRGTTGQHVNVSDARGGRIVGGDEGDRITGGALNDQLDGMEGNDTITGGNGDDTLLGGDGNDVLTSSGGDDRMLGGAGDDSFVILRSAGITTLADYDVNNLLERIDLTDFGGVSRFSNLTVTNEGSDVRVTATNLDILIKGAQASDLDATDFLFKGQDPLVFNVKPQTGMAELQHLLDAAPAGAVINLAAGTYSVTETLRITRSDISLVGAGEGKTILRTDIADANASETILVQPRSLMNRIGAIAEDAAEGTTTVTLQPGHGLSVGDILYLNQANDAAWLAATGNSDWVDPASLSPDVDPELSYLREMHSKIVAIDGNTVTLAEPLPYSFEGGIAQAAQDTFLSGVHLSGFSIQGSWGVANPFLFEDTKPEWVSVAALEFDGVRDSSMSHITITDPAAHGFKMQRNYDVTGEALTAVGAHNKDGSSGYHFYFQESFSNDFTGLTALDGRHAVLFSSFSAEHYNNIEVTRTNRDINFHGSPDSGNTIVVDRMEQDYPADSRPQWKAVSPGSQPEHPFSTIDANDVTFEYAVTGEDHDTVVAGPGGAYISTNAGRDTLIGGAGNDTLDGGTGPDTMSGGGGRDRFIRQFADQDDTILDFEGGPEGDILVIRGSAYGSFSQLILRQVGADAVLDFGTGGTTTFANTLVSALKEKNFIFQSDTQPGQRLTPRADQMTIIGTDRADTIVATRSHISSPDFLVRGGGGFDTVQIATGSLAGELSSMGSFYKIDAFDVSSVANVSISISNQMAVRSDNGKFYLMMGDTGGLELDVGILTSGKSIWVDGAREVQLVGSTFHKLSATDRIGVHITGADAVDKITGGAKGDWIDGGAGNDSLYGKGGDDTIYGGLGADTMTGGQGSDLFYVDNVGDRIIEDSKWSGTDEVIASVSYKIGSAAVERLTLVGDAITGTGNGRKNLITGNDHNNILDGGLNADTMVGGLGDDIYVVDDAGDVVVEDINGGIDTVRAYRGFTLSDNVENLTLQDVRDKAGNGVQGFRATGNNLDNVITGNIFDNVLIGGLGNDTLRGRGGADNFVFNTALGDNNVDHIVDFTAVDDQLVLNSGIFGIAKGALAADAFRLGASALDADDRILYDQATGRLYLDSDGDGAAAAQLFAILDNKAVIAADDFLFN